MKIYKYSPDNKWVKLNLRENQFHFNFPANFNDPFDCMCSVKFVGTKKEFSDFFTVNNIVGSYQDALFENLQNIGGNLFTMKNFPKNNQNKNVLATCFSEEVDNLLLWSFYAEHHKGLCLEFETVVFDEKEYLKFDEEVFDYSNPKTPKNLIPIFQVKYHNEKKMWVYNKFTDFNVSDLFKLVYHKNIIWEYEKEYRALTMHGYYKKLDYKFDKRHLTAIYLGCKMKQYNIDKYIKLINENYISKGFQVKIFKCIRKEGYIELEFEELI